MTSASVTVLLFARYRDQLGFDRLIVPEDHCGTVGSIVSYLRSLPGGAVLPERPMVAVNMHQVGLAHPVAAGDEVALLPPMAGG